MSWLSWFGRGTVDSRSGRQLEDLRASVGQDREWPPLQTPPATTGVAVREVEQDAAEDMDALETTAWMQNADRDARAMYQEFMHEMDLANTPTSFIYGDDEDGEEEFLPDSSDPAWERFEQHLRQHPELRDLPQWEGAIAWDEVAGGDAQEVRDVVEDLDDVDEHPF